MKGSVAMRLAFGATVLVGAMAASSAGLAPAVRASVSAPSTPHLIAFGSRSLEQWRSPTLSKLDGALADVARHANRIRPDHIIEDLHSLNPAARFRLAGTGTDPAVLIDAVTRDDPERLRTALLGLGLEHPAVYLNDVSGWLPIRNLAAAAARAEVRLLRASMGRARVGKVTSQGDAVQGSATVRTDWPSLDGTGIIVGVLSDSFDCYSVYAANHVAASGPNGYASNGFVVDAAADQASGDLPPSVTVIEEPGDGTTAGTCMDYGPPEFLPYADEGRAMLQIVHDVAPGAGLAFHTASEGEADFATGITQLASQGAKVIVDDFGYFDEPFYQDGLVAQAVDAVAAQGVAYFSAAGNEGQLSYENTSPSFNTTSTSAPNAGEMLLDFAPSGAATNTSLPVTIPPLVPGEFVALIVQWDQPYATAAQVADGAGASSQIDLCVIGVSGTDSILNGYTGAAATCTGPNAIGNVANNTVSGDPLQVLVVGNPANASGNTTQETFSVNIGLVNGTAAPGRIKLVVADDGAGSTIDAFDTKSPTIQGHPTATGAAAVGAAYFAATPACGTSPAQLEPYSSAGGTPILFDSSGTALATPQTRQKPDFVGPDGVNTTFFGFVQSGTGSGAPQCMNDTALPSFFGTSAAAPHAAAAAALLLQSNPAVTASQVITALQHSAAPMNQTSSPDNLTGYGFIRVDQALALLPPPAPTISLSPASITVGGSSTLTWGAVNVTGCTASGSWSGSQKVSGAMNLTPTATGTLTYTVTCSNQAGSAMASAMLAVAAAPMSSGGGGGGGSLDAAALLTLASLACARRLRARRRRTSLG
jgi:subtilase family protein